MIPGSNILNMALSVLGQQSFAYYSFNSRYTNYIGIDTPIYNAPVNLLGSIQPVPRTMYQTYGLDLQKNYVNVYVSQALLDIDRDISGDLIIFQGANYQCISKTAWAGIDGWDAVLCVQIQNIPIITGVTYPASGTYTMGNPLNFAITYNQNVIVTGNPYLVLTPVTGILGGNAIYSGGSGTSIITFSYTVLNTDTANGLNIANTINTTTSTIYNASGTIPASVGFIAPSLGGVILN